MSKRVPGYPLPYNCKNLSVEDTCITGCDNPNDFGYPEALEAGDDCPYNLCAQELCPCFHTGDTKSRCHFAPPATDEYEYNVEPTLPDNSNPNPDPTPKPRNVTRWRCKFETTDGTNICTTGCPYPSPRYFGFPAIPPGAPCKFAKYGACGQYSGCVCYVPGTKLKSRCAPDTRPV